MPRFMSTFRRKALATTSGAVVLAAGVSGATWAEPPMAIYGGGATSTQFVYRDMFNCWGSTSTTVPTLGTTSCMTGVDSIDPAAGEVLYSPVGSGAGLYAYLANDPTQLGTPGNVTAPYTSGDYPAYPYPALTFGAGNAPLSANQVSSFNAAHQAAWGPALQLPTLITTVALPFDANSGLNIQNPPPAGGSSGLNLSRDNMCGIFGGTITDWSDSRLAVDNQGVLLSSTSEQIKVIFRHDGSGMTFLLSNALIAQCAAAAYPMPAGWGVASSAYFIDAYNAGQLPANFYDEEDVNGNNYGSGDTGIADAVASTIGAISYTSPDFAQPFGVPGHVASPTVNLQNQASVSSEVKTFLPPLAATHAEAAISSAAPPPPNSDAAAWGAAGLVPNPTEANAYPIAGLSWMYVYSCYHDPATMEALVSGTEGLYKFIWSLWGTPGAVSYQAVVGSMHAFAPLPSNWLTAANHAAFRDAGTKIRRGGGMNAAFCSSGV